MKRDMEMKFSLQPLRTVSPHPVEPQSSEVLSVKPVHQNLCRFLPDGALIIQRVPDMRRKQTSLSLGSASGGAGTSSSPSFFPPFLPSSQGLAIL